MIIRERGLVIGKIDDKTFELIESESDRLTGLVENWVKHGIAIMGPSETLPALAASADSFTVIPTTDTFFIEVLHTELILEGFEVQTA